MTKRLILVLCVMLCFALLLGCKAETEEKKVVAAPKAVADSSADSSADAATSAPAAAPAKEEASEAAPVDNSAALTKWSEGDTILFNKDKDGYWYPGVVKGTEGSKVLVDYNLDHRNEHATASVDPLQIVPDTIKAGDHVEGNWEFKGEFFPAVVLERSGSQIKIKYIVDEFEEEDSISIVRVKLPIK